MKYREKLVLPFWCFACLLSRYPTCCWRPFRLLSFDLTFVSKLSWCRGAWFSPAPMPSVLLNCSTREWNSGGRIIGKIQLLFTYANGCYSVCWRYGNRLRYHSVFYILDCLVQQPSGARTALYVFSVFFLFKKINHTSTSCCPSSGCLYKAILHTRSLPLNSLSQSFRFVFHVSYNAQAHTNGINIEAR